MSKILVVSDSHGDDEILDKILAKFAPEMDLLIHTGDSELAPDSALIDQFHIVTGNMDFETRFPKTLDLEADGDRIFVAHGHYYNVNSGLNVLYLEGLAHEAQMVFFGHSHRLMATVEQGMLLLNPGSISFPRGEYSYLGGTFAIVENTPSQFKVQYYNRDLVPVENLKFTFER